MYYRGSTGMSTSDPRKAAVFEKKEKEKKNKLLNDFETAFFVQEEPKKDKKQVKQKDSNKIDVPKPRQVAHNIATIPESNEEDEMRYTQERAGYQPRSLEPIPIPCASRTPPYISEIQYDGANTHNNQSKEVKMLIKEHLVPQEKPLQDSEEEDEPHYIMP
mmetsp:Transcript_230/g.230  ORF Transcript_230/g.230 Transcript_230/m.230 type:complete len:161 (-) Transcript_230:101-583(-)